LHHLIESDPYETYNAKYKAENIHAFNQIKDNTTAVLVAKKAIYLKEGFVAKAGSDVQLKINNDNVPVVKPNKVYETTIKSYSIDNVINSYTYKDENEIKSIVVIDALGNELEEIDLSDPNYLIRPGFFYGFYMLKITYVDGSIKIRKK